MSRYTRNPSDPQTITIQRTNADDMQTAAAAALGALGADRLVSSINVGGAGGGSLFVLIIEHTSATDGEGLSPASAATSIRVFTATNETTLAAAQLAALTDSLAQNPLLPLRDTGVAGSSSAGMFVGFLVLGLATINAYGAGRAQMGFAELQTTDNVPATAKTFSVAGLEDSNYMAVAQFSAKGGGVAMLTRRRAFQVVGGALSALDAIEEIGTDEGADIASVAVDIAASGTSIQFNVTGIAATNLNWVVEWGVSRY